MAPTLRVRLEDLALPGLGSHFQGLRGKGPEALQVGHPDTESGVLPR